MLQTILSYEIIVREIETHLLFCQSQADITSVFVCWIEKRHKMSEWEDEQKSEWSATT